MTSRDLTTGVIGALLMTALWALAQTLDDTAREHAYAQARVEAFRAGVTEGMARVACWGGFRMDAATGLPLRTAPLVQTPAEEQR
jgi:hypothetical protein